MQKAHIRLEEVLWEITGQCKNGCVYCGSKGGWNDWVDDKTVIKIAEEIVKYPPKSVTVSGGDPLMVSYETHAKITKMFKGVGIESKVIINPKSYKILKEQYGEKETTTLDLYDWVGVSINETEELTQYMNLIVYLPTDKETIISNFNLGNVFLFDKICALVRSNKLIWQIQFTMYSDDSELAIYKNDDALSHLYSKITEARNEGVEIVLGDNMDSGSCGAGIRGVGILSNGSVVPCLSMRSWNNDSVEDYDILGLGLESIWKNGFIEYRFGEFKCCKDHCLNKCYEEKNEQEVYVSEPKMRKEDIDRMKDVFEITIPKQPFIPDISDMSKVYVYGCASRPSHTYTNFIGDQKINVTGDSGSIIDPLGMI